ncbi:MAG TPA: hypothetical protein VFQ85_09970 [Mycobacteriales bacterium]|jgi:hypothetical protein|nr:hypothetical protein [Mycobacteriales bacterium]
MGRAGRYTLSVMAWVAAYAGWSSICGLVVAAVNGGEAKGTVSIGVSAVFIPLLVSVPTLVALWFNDWARDGFPTKEQRARAAAGSSAGAGSSVTLAPLRSSSRVPDDPAPTADEAAEPETAPAEVPAGFPVAPLLRDRLDLD